MLEIINQWLAKPSGRYSDGLAIFTQLASADIKKKYLEFFKEVEGEPKPHDIHMTMLINKVSDIERNIKINPALYENVELVLKETGPDAATLKAIEEKNAQIAELKQIISELKADNSDIISENEDLNDQLEELEEGLNDAQVEVSVYEAQLSELVKELDVLKAKRGLQIVVIGDMPDDIRKVYERNKEITPLMAKIHSEISVEGLHYKTREKLVKQLCEYDDERRANWDKIDDWSEGRETKDFTVEKPEFDVDPVIAGVQIGRRIERLKENISRSKTVAETAEKETIKSNAEKRIAAYELELSELEEKVKPAEQKGDVE